MRAITVVHEDDHLVVIDKPAGMLVVDAPGRRGPTVVDCVARQLGTPVHAVHRLDEDTTGLLALARTDAARSGMEELFRTHAIEREYLALASAAPSPPAGRIEARLAEDAHGIVRVVRQGGQSATTDYETLGRRGRCTLLRCRLLTGRRNQIRAHLAAMGCPLAGDRKYGFRARPGEAFRRPMLHSWRMAFLHPITSTRVELVAWPSAPELDPR
jgi:23S rRNA pseudouridine1911/1915/1917 synthase